MINFQDKSHKHKRLLLTNERKSICQTGFNGDYKNKDTRLQVMRRLITFSQQNFKCSFYYFKMHSRRDTDSMEIRKMVRTTFVRAMS